MKNNTIKKITCALLALFAALTLCACGSTKGAETDGARDMTGAAPSDRKTAEKDYSKSELAEEGDLLYGAVADVDASGADIEPGVLVDDGITDPGDGTPSKDTVDAVAGTLTAGEWKDNDNFDFWQNVVSREDWQGYAAEWKLNVTRRFVVTATDGQNAAKNVTVELFDADGGSVSKAVTDSYGKAYLYYDLASYGKTPVKCAVTPSSVLDTDGNTVDLTADDLAAGGITVSSYGVKYKALDLMFTTDTTGSMSDELEYLKKELGNVIERVAAENDQLDIRLSVNFYRDEGDEYVVRDFAFSGDVAEVQSQLDQQFSDGGGDWPEAVHTALANSINDHDWRDDAVKLLFLTLDAPGHSEVAGVAESIRTSIEAAAAQGIRIIPVAASGVDGSTEYLLRTMACATGGSYIFLTDDSGVGNSHLEPTIGDYNVKKLNDLLVNVINEYCK